MVRESRLTLVVERATTTENALGEAVQEWAADGTVTVTVAPASASVRSQAALRGVTVSHTLVAPAGFQADPLDTRLRGNDGTYRPHGVTITAAGTIMEVEVTRG